jgi:hypothetical protein
MSDPGKHRARDAWGPREVMAIVIIGGSFMLAGIALVADKEGATIPAWVAGLVGGVALFYFRNGEAK